MRTTTFIQETIVHYKNSSNFVGNKNQRVSNKIPTKLMDYENYSDEQIVNGILDNDRPLIEYFFTKKCSKLLLFIMKEVFHYKVDIRALESELFLYIASDNWKKLRQFEYRSSLLTYISVISVRFFLKRRGEMDTEEPSSFVEFDEPIEPSRGLSLESSIDVRNAISKISNEKYRYALNALDLQDMSYEQLAEQMGTNVDNLYNIHRRAKLQLKLIMTRKEDYYD